jgi:hypothetical protein
MLIDLEARVQSRLEEARKRRLVRPPSPPRYDELFAKGVAWLDSLAGAAMSPAHGRLRVDQSVWSECARGDDLP